MSIMLIIRGDGNNVTEIRRRLKVSYEQFGHSCCRCSNAVIYIAIIFKVDTEVQRELSRAAEGIRILYQCLSKIALFSSFVFSVAEAAADVNIMIGFK